MKLALIEKKNLLPIITGMGNVKRGGVPLDEKARYFVGPMSNTDYPSESKLASETRFGNSVSSLLSASKIKSLENGVGGSNKLKSGDTIGVLNNGFVEYMSHFGSDDEIANDARTSYKNGGLKTNNEGLIRYLYRQGHCFDAKTEVLTQRGYVLWSDVIEGDCLATVQKDGSFQYEKPKKLVQFDHEGELYKVEHGGVDLMVTLNHNMYVKLYPCNKETKKNSWEKDYQLVEAQELDNRSMVRYCKVANFVGNDFIGQDTPSADAPRAFLRFLGFFIGDGSAGGTYKSGVKFSLKKQRKIDYLLDVCTELGWECVQNGSRFYVTGDSKDLLGVWFAENCYNGGRKVIPKHLVSSLNHDDAQALLDGLRNSDGSIKRGAWCYSTSSKELSEQIQVVGFHAGEAVQLNKPQEYGYGEAIYGLMFMSRMTHPVINQGKRNTSRVPYSGKVYCAETSTGVLVVRRNGKVVLSGNSSPFEMGAIKVRMCLPIFVYRQLFRHRTAKQLEPEGFISNDAAFGQFSAHNEMSGRYVTMPNMYYVPELAAVQGQSTNNKQGREKGALSVTEKKQILKSWNADIKNHRDSYKCKIKSGMAKELARCNLPNSQYTLLVWRIDIHNLFHFLGLRLHSHAQFEVREYANAIAEIAKQKFPIAYKAFEDYRLGAKRFTKYEWECLSSVVSKDTKEAMLGAFMMGCDNKREVEEFKTKLGLTQQKRF